MRRRVSFFDWARSYCGDPHSWQERGLMTRELLRTIGCQSEHRVLELGCGALSAGEPLIRYLNKGGYVGIEPNGWLVEAAIHDLELGQLVHDKDASFLWRSDFDASELGGTFDFAVAHSVLSHAAAWQFPMMLRNVRLSLSKDGKILASLRLGPNDSNAVEWAYPHNTYFTPKTVRVTARACGFKAYFKRDFRRRMVEVAPNDFHDWVVFQRVPFRERVFAPYSVSALEKLGLSAEDAEDAYKAGAGRMVERVS